MKTKSYLPTIGCLCVVILCVALPVFLYFFFFSYSETFYIPEIKTYVRLERIPFVNAKMYFSKTEEMGKVWKKIEHLNDDLMKGSDKIHMIWFLINSQSARTLVGNDGDFIKRTIKLKIPIYFIITRSLTPGRGKEFHDAPGSSLCLAGQGGG